LYASTLPLVIYALMGTSRQLAVGPAAMVSLLTAASIGTLAEAGTETYLALAVALALLVGLIQFVLGVARLGFLVNFLSTPVISGFTSAAALIIGTSQLQHLLGIDLPHSRRIGQLLWQSIQQIEQIHGLTLGLGLLGILLLTGIKRLRWGVPGPLLVVVLGIGAVWVFGLESTGVQVVGAVPSGLPTLSLPTWDFALFKTLFPMALAIALVSFLESNAIAKSVQAKHKNYRIAPNQELIALGLANVGSALVQAFPITGGLSRTAVNDQAGARTGMASIISALLIVLTLLFLTPVFYFLPKAILAAVILVAAVGLIDFKTPIRLWRVHRSDCWMLLATFVGTLVLGIQMGIVLGVVLSLAVIIFDTTRPHMAILGKVPGKSSYRNIDRFTQLKQRPELLIIRFDARLYFANLNYFQEQLDTWLTEKGNRLQVLIISAISINSLDSSALQLLRELVDSLRAQGKDVYFTGVKGPVRDLLRQAGLLEHIGRDNFFMTTQEAVDYFDQLGGKRSTQWQEYTLQTNVREE
ncbi:MAG: sulfate permease, partial [Bacteroidota bacterium]